MFSGSWSFFHRALFDLNNDPPPARRFTLGFERGARQPQGSPPRQLTFDSPPFTLDSPPFTLDSPPFILDSPMLRASGVKTFLSSRQETQPIKANHVRWMMTSFLLSQQQRTLLDRIFSLFVFSQSTYFSIRFLSFLASCSLHRIGLLNRAAR